MAPSNSCSSCGGTYSEDLRIPTSLLVSSQLRQRSCRVLMEPIRSSCRCHSCCCNASLPMQAPTRNQGSKPSHNMDCMSSGRSDILPSPMGHQKPRCYHIGSLPSNHGYRKGGNRHLHLAPIHYHTQGRIPTDHKERGCRRTSGTRRSHPEPESFLQIRLVVADLTAKRLSTCPLVFS